MRSKTIDFSVQGTPSVAGGTDQQQLTKEPEDSWDIDLFSLKFKKISNVSLSKRKKKLCIILRFCRKARTVNPSIIDEKNLTLPCKVGL